MDSLRPLTARTSLPALLAALLPVLLSAPPSVASGAIGAHTTIGHSDQTSRQAGQGYGTAASADQSRNTTDLTDLTGSIGSIGQRGDTIGRAGRRQSRTGRTVRGGAAGSSTRWGWPLAGSPRVLRGFAPPAHPWLAGHRGVDLAATPGLQVHSAGEGIVGYAGPLAERGVVTVLHADGLRTTYLPVQPSVRHGQTVGRGEVIGIVQDVPGHCPATCLHWGLLREHLYLDPLLLVGRGQVRLLPHWPHHGTSLLARLSEPSERRPHLPRSGQ